MHTTDDCLVDSKEKSDEMKVDCLGDERAVVMVIEKVYLKVDYLDDVMAVVMVIV